MKAFQWLVIAGVVVYIGVVCVAGEVAKPINHILSQRKNTRPPGQQ